jgi:anti-anti-sigma factor
MIESAGADGVRIELVGELDLSVAGRLRDRLDALAGPGATVVLDLSKLDFIDSSGIHAIITYHRQAEQDGWALLVEQQMTLAVRRVINVMGLDQVFWPRGGVAG